MYFDQLGLKGKLEYQSSNKQTNKKYTYTLNSHTSIGRKQTEKVNKLQRPAIHSAH